MAKAKKSDSSAAPKPAAKKTTRRTKKAAAPSTGAAPMVDTGLAAQAAARMLAAKAKLGISEPETPENTEKESGSFKQLKESLNRPASHAASTALGNTFGPHKSNLPTTRGTQVFHNQTQGGLSINVPRRTNG